MTFDFQKLTLAATRLKAPVISNRRTLAFAGRRHRADQVAAEYEHRLVVNPHLAKAAEQATERLRQRGEADFNRRLSAAVKELVDSDRQAAKADAAA